MLELGKAAVFVDSVDPFLQIPQALGLEIAVSQTLLQGDEGTNNDKREHASRYENVYITGRHNFYWDSNNKKFSVKEGVMDWWGADSEVGKTWCYENKIFTFTRSPLYCGIITKKKTYLGEDVYYYRCGGMEVVNKSNVQNITIENQVVYRRLYSTDIILLGNLEDIYDHLPRLYKSLPTTTATFPPIGTSFDMLESGMSKHCYRTQIINGSTDVDICDVFGFYSVPDSNNIYYLNFHYNPFRNPNYENQVEELMASAYTGDVKTALLDGAKRGGTVGRLLISKLTRRTSLFFNLVSRQVHDVLAYDIPSFVNLSRICELDVHNDTAFKVGNTTIPTNGMIDVYDISTNENRSAFASMNYDINKYYIDELGNRKYFSTPIVVNGFDGRLIKYIASDNLNYSAFNTQTPKLANDDVDNSYMAFRFGYYKGWPGPFCEDEGVFGTAGTAKYTTTNYANGPLYLPQNSFYFYFGLKNGKSALDVLYNKYLDAEDDIVSENSGYFSIQQNGKINCSDQGEELGSVTLSTYDLAYPFNWEITQGLYTFSAGTTSDAVFDIDNLIANRNYKITIVDSANKTYTANFNVDGQSISIGSISTNNPFEEKHEIIISTINETPITCVSGKTGQGERMDIPCEVEGQLIGEFYYFSGGTGNTLNVYYTTGDAGVGGVDNKVRLKFDSNFDSWYVEEADAGHILHIYFPQQVEIIKITCELLRTSCFDADWRYPCISSETTCKFQPYLGTSLYLNNIPVKYYNGWGPYEWWSPSNSSDVPDSKFVEEGKYQFNVFDSINTAHPDQTTTTWINNNRIKHSLNRGFDFFEEDGSVLSYNDQLRYVSSLCGNVFDGKTMSLLDTRSSVGYTPMAIYPNYSLPEYKDEGNHWDADVVFTGDNKTNIQAVSVLGTVGGNINIPHIVGLNYPTSYDSVTMLKDCRGNTYDELVAAYINNETITSDLNTNSEFGINLFALRCDNFPSADEPMSGITPSSDITESTTGRWELSDGINGYFGLRTVDKRMDYQFVGRTPLLLPSGYDEFTNLKTRALVQANFDIDLYGGFRLNYVGDDSTKQLTSYRTKGEDAQIKFFGWPDDIKKNWISSVAGDDIVDYFNSLDSTERENYVKNKSAAASLYDFNTVRESLEENWIKENAECWLMSQYKKAKDDGMLNSWLEDIGSYILVGSGDFLKKTEDEQKTSLKTYYERKYDGLTAYDAKIYWLKNKAKNLEDNNEWKAEHEDDLSANTITKFLLGKFEESGDTFVQEEFSDEYDEFSGLTSGNAQTYFAEDMFENLAILKYCTDKTWYNGNGTNMDWVKTTGFTQISEEYNSATNKKTWIVNKCVDYRFAMLNGLNTTKKYEFVTTYGNSKTFFNNCEWVSITGQTSGGHTNYPNADKLRGAIITKFCELADVNASEAQEFAQSIDGFLVSSEFEEFRADSEWINSQLLSGSNFSLAFYSYLYDELKGEFGPSTNDFASLLNHVYPDGRKDLGILQRFDTALLNKQYSWIKDKCGDDLLDEFKNGLVENQYNWFVGNEITECYEFFFGQDEEDKKTWLNSSLLANDFKQLTPQEQEEWVKDNASTWAINYFNTLDTKSEKEKWIYKNAGNCALYDYSSDPSFVSKHADEWAMADFNELSEDEQHDFVLRNSGNIFVEEVGSWTDSDKEEWFVEKVGGQMYDDFVNIRSNLSGETRTKWLHEKSSDIALMEFNSLPQQTNRISDWVNETFGDGKYNAYTAATSSAQANWLNDNYYDSENHFTNANDISGNSYNNSIKWNIYNAGSSNTGATWVKSSWVKDRAKTYAKYKIAQTQNNETLKSWVKEIGKESFYYQTYGLCTTNNGYKNLLSSLASKYQKMAFSLYDDYSDEQISFVSANTVGGEGVEWEEFSIWTREKQLTWVGNATKEMIQNNVGDNDDWWKSDTAENYLSDVAERIIGDVYNHISGNTEERDSFIIDLYVDFAYYAHHYLMKRNSDFLTHSGSTTEDNWLSGSTINGVSATTLSANSTCLMWATAEYDNSIKSAKEKWIKEEAEGKIDNELDILNNRHISVYMSVWKKCMEWARTIYNTLSESEKEAYLKELYAQRTEIGFFGWDNEQEEGWIRKIGGQKSVNEFDNWSVDDAVEYFLSVNGVNEVAFYDCENETQKEDLLESKKRGLYTQYSTMTSTTTNIKAEYIRKNATEAILNEYAALTYKDARKYWFIDICGGIKYHQIKKNSAAISDFIQDNEIDFEVYDSLSGNEKESLIKTVVGEEAFDEYNGLVKVSDKNACISGYAESWYSQVFLEEYTEANVKYREVYGYNNWMDWHWWIYFHSSGTTGVRVDYVNGEIIARDIEIDDPIIHEKVVESLIKEFNSAAKEDAREHWLNDKMSNVSLSEETFSDSWAESLISEYKYITNNTEDADYKEKCRNMLIKQLVEKYGGNWKTFNAWKSGKKSAWVESKDVTDIYNNILYLGSENVDDANEVITGFANWWIYLNGGDWTLMKFNAMSTNEKRSFVYDNGGGDLITGGPQRFETFEGRGDGAKLFNVSFNEDNSFNVSQGQITENDINVWDMVTDYELYYDEVIPLYTMPSDIDRVKYSINHLTSGDTSFNASFTDCSTSFSDGFVYPGNTENISLSYKSGVKVIEKVDVNAFDVEYVFDNLQAYSPSGSSSGSSASTSAFTETFAIISGTSLSVKITDDEAWGGQRFTDTNLSGSDNVNVYPHWADDSDGDIVDGIKTSELAAYICTPNSDSSERPYTPIYIYNFRMVGDAYYDKTKFVCPYITNEDLLTESPASDYYLSSEESNLCFVLENSLSEITNENQGVIDSPSDEPWPSSGQAYSAYSANSQSLNGGGVVNDDDDDDEPLSADAPDAKWGMMPGNSFLVIPTRKIYTHAAQNTLLKQGVIYNRGYAYYTGSMLGIMILNKGSVNVRIRVNTPIRNSDGYVDYATNTIKYNEFHNINWHTFGEVDTNNIYCPDENDVTVTYKRDKMEFNVKRNVDSSIKKTTVYFNIINGLRYKMTIYFEHEDSE